MIIAILLVPVSCYSTGNPMARNKQQDGKDGATLADPNSFSKRLHHGLMPMEIHAPSVTRGRDVYLYKLDYKCLKVHAKSGESLKGSSPLEILSIGG